MPEADKISREEIEEFAGKLQKWGDELSIRERALLQLMLAKAKETETADVEGYVAATSVKDAATAALDAISDRFAIAPIARPKVWLQLGPVWVKSLPPTIIA
jgi:hypothetical protein